MTGGSWDYPQGVQGFICADRLGSLEEGLPRRFFYVIGNSVGISYYIKIILRKSERRTSAWK